MCFHYKIGDPLRKPKLCCGILGVIIVIILVAVIACNYRKGNHTETLKENTIIEDTCVLVKIHNGQLKGRKGSSSINKEFYAFQEIPFAKPPVRELRLRNPVPQDNWDGILDVTRNTKTCFQYNNFLHKANFEEAQTEDCLYLNVYTPVCPSSGESLSVMFYIYGSGYLSGSSDYENFGPDHLMDNDIIVVTSNHRLGPLGFISTGDTVIPGNYGMKDQVLALKWVKENIKYFGGDPKKVSIVGHSSGASSVGLHLMSKLSKGLYNSAACLSGSSLEPWSYQIYHKRIAYQLAGILDSDFHMNSSSRELLQLLRRFPANDINKAVKKLPQSLLYNMDVQGFVFTPVLEPEHENAFITKNIYNAVKDGQMDRVPLLIGMVSEEALALYDGSLSQQVEDWKKAATVIDADHSLMVLDNMNIIDENEKARVGEAIRDLYPRGLFSDDLGKTVKYFSETTFNRGIIRHAELQSNFSDVYFYRFSYHSPSNGIKPRFAGAHQVGHGDDNIFLWIFNGLNICDRALPMDILTSKRYRTIITNFVKYSNPTPNKTRLLNNVIWPKVRPDNFQFLEINETITIHKDPMTETYRGWVDIYERMTRKPLMTF